MTTMHEALAEAMHLSDDRAVVEHMAGHGYAVASIDTMSQAVHDVYCGITADHGEPNEKDRAQAQLMLDSLVASSG